MHCMDEDFLKRDFNLHYTVLIENYDVQNLTIS